MIIRKKELPNNYIEWKNKSDISTERFPFHVKEFGYCNEKKIEFGNKYSYSDILVLYSYSGVVRFSKNSSTNFVYDHHVILSACNTPLQFTRVSAKWEFFYIIISGTHAKFYYNLIRTKNNTLAINPLTPILSYFIDLVSSNCSQTDYCAMEHSLLIHNILFELYKTVFDISHARTYTPIQETDVNNAIHFISTNYMKDLTIDDICTEVNLSKYYFCKIFKEHTGVTIHKFLNEYRVNKSKELLSYSKLSITSISLEVGFNTALTYMRCFKNSTDMTPSEYRRYF